MDKPPTSHPLEGLTSHATVSLDTIPDVDPLSNEGQRINQQGLQPSSVKARNVGDGINSSHQGLGGGLRTAFTIPSGFSASFILTLTDKAKRVMLAIPDVGLYVNGEESTANAWPTATLGMGTMPVTVYNDWGLTDNVNIVTRVVWRNNSSVDQPVIVVIRWRIITNSSLAFAQGQQQPSGLTGTGTAAGGLGGGP